MIRRAAIPILLLLSALALFGFKGKVLLEDYKSKNAEEENVIATLIAYEKAYNKKDKELLITYFSENAKLMPCGEGPNQFSKVDYAKKFPDKWDSFPEYSFFNPEVTILEKKAEVKLNLYSGGWIKNYKIKLINKNGKWLIQETSF
jgi:hypothetical protein